MAGVSDPQPDKILNYPQNGELMFLFRKKLTSYDFQRALVLTAFSSYHLRSLPGPLLNVITRDGLTVWCYTPAIHHGVVLRSHGDMPNFRFKKPGWDQIVATNGFLIGQQIDCWALFDAEDGPHGNLSFLIQPVRIELATVGYLMKLLREEQKHQVKVKEDQHSEQCLRNIRP